MKLLSTILLVLMAMTVRSQMEGPVTLCGRRLSTARAFICYGLDEMKKRGHSFETPSSTELSQQSWEPEEWPWGSRHEALGMHWPRHKRGLVDECCLKPCTVNEILNYC